MFYILSGGAFMIFGSADIQDWDGGVVVEKESSNSSTDSSNEMYLKSIENINERK